MKTTQIIIGLVFFSTLKLHATNFWNWDVETDITSQKKAVTYIGPSSAVTTEPHSGLKCMKITMIGTDEDHQLGADNQGWNDYTWDIIGGPELYYRWWMKIMPGFDWGKTNTRFKASRVGGSKRSRTYTGYLANDAFVISECDGDFGCRNQSGKNFDGDILINFDFSKQSDGKWHEYIVMVKPNTSPNIADAQFKSWVDGKFIGEYLNWTLSIFPDTPNTMSDMWGCWMVRPFMHLNTGAGGILYLDDFSTDDTWNSTQWSKPGLTNTIKNKINSAPPFIKTQNFYFKDKSLNFILNPSSFKELKIHVYNALGINYYSEVFRNNNIRQHVVTLNNVPPGIYLIVIEQNGKGNINTVKLINQN